MGQTWEVAAREIEHSGSYHLGKYPREVATWEKFFGKVTVKGTGKGTGIGTGKGNRKVTGT